MKYSKAQGMSINVIIVAALALAVLVIVFAIFTGRLGGFVRGTENCQNIGGTCEATCTAGETTPFIAGKTNCEGTTPTCCVPIPGSS